MDHKIEHQGHRQPVIISRITKINIMCRINDSVPRILRKKENNS